MLRLVPGWQLTPHAIPALAATFAALAMLALTYPRRHAPGAPAFALLVVATAVWSGFEAAILCAPDLPTKLLLTKFEYAGIVTAPLAWLLFAVRYCAQDRWLARLAAAGAGDRPRDDARSGGVHSSGTAGATRAFDWWSATKTSPNNSYIDVIVHDDLD